MSGEFIRFLVVGVFNTIAGYAIFLFGLWGLSMNAFAANAMSYIIVVFVAYFITAKFVFKKPIAPSGMGQFLVAFSIAFGLNQAVLLGFDQFTDLRPEIAQVFAMGTYTVVFFLLNKFIVFRSSEQS